MNSKKRVLTVLAVFLMLCAAAWAISFTPASNTFYIPERAPDIKITANTMHIASDVVILEGNVRATREGDILTCDKAYAGNSPKWLLASVTPMLYRRENVIEQKLIRETTINASNIYLESDSGVFNASDSVSVRIEEHSWDTATNTWVLITSVEMTGYKNSSRMIFSGNVRIRDGEKRFGRGKRLDYQKNKSMAILSGDAFMEVWERNDQGKLEKRTLKGQRITYNTETKEAFSE